MAILYNMEPLAAMELFYGGKRNGVPPEDFDRSREENGIEIPPVLRKFLENYAYLEINKGQVTFFDPEDIRVLHLPVEGGTVHIMVVGRVDETFIGIDIASKRFDIAVGNIEDSRVIWEQSDGMELAGMMRIMFMSTLFKTADKFVFRGAEIGAVLKSHGAERSKIAPSNGSAQHISINFDEEKGEFLIAEFDKSGDTLTFLHVVPRTEEKSSRK